MGSKDGRRDRRTTRGVQLKTVLVTGSASGMGAATTERLLQTGHRVLGIDRHDADIVADLSHAEGRAQAVEAVKSSERVLGGVVACAGLGVPGPDPAAIVSVNFF